MYLPGAVTALGAQHYGQLPSSSQFFGGGVMCVCVCGGGWGQGVVGGLCMVLHVALHVSGI